MWKNKYAMIFQMISKYLQTTTPFLVLFDASGGGWNIGYFYMKCNNVILHSNLKMIFYKKIVLGKIEISETMNKFMSSSFFIT